MRLFERICGADERGTKAFWFSLLFNSIGLPGLGSICLGRRVGYLQIGISLAGAAVLCFWIYEEISRWVVVFMAEATFVIDWKWAIVGCGLNFVAWIWALGTSMMVWRARARFALSRPPPIG